MCPTQIQILQQEKEHLSQELEGVYRMHHEQLELQQLQHYQVGRSSFRHAFKVCSRKKKEKFSCRHG